MRFLLVVILGFLSVLDPILAQRGFVKLPPQVNHNGLSELVPVISVDGSWLYFTRSRAGADSQTVFDIWRTQITNDTHYSKAEIIGGNLSSRFGIAVTSLSPDNNVLYLMGKLYEATPPDERIYRSTLARDGWELPQPVKIKALKPRGTFTDYSFAPDQRTLVMSIERDSSMGGRDLYLSFYHEAEDVWSEPLWLGTRVNSIYNEITPFLAPDNRTLYFSSERPDGIGECDVYRVVRKDDSWQNWTYPENLGPSINRPGRTMYYTEDARGEQAYFVWRKDQQSYTDIYRATIEKRRQVSTVLVQAKVVDEAGRPIEASIKYASLAGSSSGIARSNPATGAFTLSLNGNSSYTIEADRVGYTAAAQSLRLDSVQTNAELTLVLRALKVGTTARLNNIFFETNGATLFASSHAELDRLYLLMKVDTSVVISVEGHTDDVGSSDHNNALSKSRAEAVRAYLISKGISTERIKATGFGATKPQVTNADDASRAQNRRVEFRILAKRSD